MSARWRHLTLAMALAVAFGAAPLRGQTIRITGGSTLRYIELRSLVRDSVPSSAAPGDRLLRQLADGRVVRCIPGEGYCRDVRPGANVSTVPVIHDLNATAWGFGRGTQLVAQLRGRSSFGGDPALWPRADDAFDVVSLYGEIERDRLRARVGRQWRMSGLGYYNFDGLAVAARPVATTWIEIWAGRSLVRGLNEARTAPALEAVEPLSLPNAGLLAGVQVRFRPSTRLAISAQYQVDARGDRRALYSELAAADAVWRVSAGSAEAALEVDVATSTINQARLLVRSRPLGRVSLSSEVRRYRPYFEQWTIWGAFSPIGFDEARAGLIWATPAGTLVVRGDGSYRVYEDAGVGSTVEALETSGWGAAASAAWSPATAWRLDGAYRVDAGFGAARRDAQLGATRLFANAGSIGLHGVLFERLYEFRLSEGTALGIAVEAGWRVNDRVRASGHAMAYRHLEAGPSAIDWTQRRAMLRLEWAVGRDAESAARPRAASRGAP